ncbi:hypothetical protein M5D96_008302 [Drosophila gunungcola]|uniref:Uncharacterized protein n=1 Tax=Drosophila gunungcola TaxID=103775 RepID=A0A9Q0BNX3_9MUSC|nr:hypothetical protein M5D96_008302 [Drosophila gunungcola]
MACDDMLWHVTHRRKCQIWPACGSRYRQEPNSRATSSESNNNSTRRDSHTNLYCSALLWVIVDVASVPNCTGISS